MFKKLLILLCLIAFEQTADALAVTYTFSPNTLISSSQINQNFADIEAVVNALTAVNIADASITAAKLNADVVRTGYGVKLHTDGSLMVDVSDSLPGLELEDGGVRVKTYASGILYRANEGLLWGRGGDMVLSSNSDAPAGFSNVSATYDNKFIRISSGGLTTGGSDTHDHGGATASHTLTAAEMPEHAHPYYSLYNPGDQLVNRGGSGNSAASNSSLTSGSAGGGSGHAHGISTANNVPAYVSLYMYQKA